jgi:SAM-dependent methyltransferase
LALADLEQVLRPRPAARYVHPRARPEEGVHESHLDVAGENSPNYATWVAQMIKPHLGYRVLEVGAGIGTITTRYAEGHSVHATDISPECVRELQLRFDGWANVSVSQDDIREMALAGRKFDSIVMVNVLEHIEDDSGLLAGLKTLLALGGNIVLYVPALNGLYGRLDHLVGHYRRYSKWRMRAVAEEAGLRPVVLRYANSLAIPAWFAYSRSRTSIDITLSSRLSLWDRVGVPVSRSLENAIRVPIGLNVLAVLEPIEV